MDEALLREAKENEFLDKTISKLSGIERGRSCVTCREKWNIQPGL